MCGDEGRCGVFEHPPHHLAAGLPTEIPFHLRQGSRQAGGHGDREQADGPAAVRARKALHPQALGARATIAAVRDQLAPAMGVVRTLWRWRSSTPSA